MCHTLLVCGRRMHTRLWGRQRRVGEGEAEEGGGGLEQRAWKGLGVTGNFGQG